MFYKADALRYDQNFFKPVSQLKTSVIVWYLMNPEPPCHVVSHLTASQVKSIWGITEEELEEMYFDESGLLFSLVICTLPSYKKSCLGALLPCCF